MPTVRQPAVAGSFYPARRDDLARALEECFLHPLGPGALPQVDRQGPGRIAALVSPHAGYMYSGPAAAHGFAALAGDGVPEVAVILGPSHHSLGRAAAVSTADAWLTPLGEAPLDAALARELVAATDLLVADEAAHQWEHSLEVQVPFLQFIYGDDTPPLVPICVRAHPMDDLDLLVSDVSELGGALAKALSGRRAVVVASTDLSHQIPQRDAERQDRLAVEQMLAMDPAGLLRTVQEHRISTCGPVPVAIAMAYCLARGGGEAELLRYYTSGDVIGDRAAVVGYASLVIRLQGR